MTTEQGLVRQDQEVTRLDPQALIAQAIEKGAGIEMMERLFALAKEVRAGQAREAWYEAMAQFQRDCPAIKKTARAKIVLRGGGSYEYRYAPLDEITSTISPVMGALGLSVSWRSRVEPDQVVVSCRISHSMGHAEESGEISIPITKGDGAGANDAQRVGIAATYAKRYSLLGIIGMAPEADDDAASGGDTRPREAEPVRAEERGSGQHPEATITEPQLKRLMAIAAGAPEKWSEEQLHTLISGFQYNSRKDIKVRDYDAIVDKVKLGPTAGLKRSAA